MEAHEAQVGRAGRGWRVRSWRRELADSCCHVPSRPDACRCCKPCARLWRQHPRRPPPAPAGAAARGTASGRAWCRRAAAGGWGVWGSSVPLLCLLLALLAYIPPPAPASTNQRPRSLEHPPRLHPTPQILGCVGARLRSHQAHQLLLGIMITQLDQEPAVRSLAAEALLGEPRGWEGGPGRGGAWKGELEGPPGHQHAAPCPPPQLAPPLALPSRRPTFPPSKRAHCRLCGAAQGVPAGHDVCERQAGGLSGAPPARPPRAAG